MRHAGWRWLLHHEDWRESMAVRLQAGRRLEQRQRRAVPGMPSTRKLQLPPKQLLHLGPCCQANQLVCPATGATYPLWLFVHLSIALLTQQFRHVGCVQWLFFCCGYMYCSGVQKALHSASPFSWGVCLKSKLNRWRRRCAWREGGADSAEAKMAQLESELEDKRAGVKRTVGGLSSRI